MNQFGRPLWARAPRLEVWHRVIEFNELDWVMNKYPGTGPPEAAIHPVAQDLNHTDA